MPVRENPVLRNGFFPARRHLRLDTRTGVAKHPDLWDANGGNRVG